jgi:hypothetical protein
MSGAGETLKMLRLRICDCVCLVVWLQVAGFGGGEAFTSETFTGSEDFELEEMEVFAVSGYP